MGETILGVRGRAMTHFYVIGNGQMKQQLHVELAKSGIELAVWYPFASVGVEDPVYLRAEAGEGGVYLGEKAEPECVGDWRYRDTSEAVSATMAADVEEQEKGVPEVPASAEPCGVRRDSSRGGMKGGAGREPEEKGPDLDGDAVGKTPAANPTRVRSGRNDDGSKGYGVAETAATPTRWRPAPYLLSKRHIPHGRQTDFEREREGGCVGLGGAESAVIMFNVCVHLKQTQVLETRFYQFL